MPFCGTTAKGANLFLFHGALSTCLRQHFAAMQVAQLLLLWAVFLAFQMVKSKYGNCTKEYLVLFLAQTVFCISVTTFFMRRELADLGKPEAEQHGDPEMHQLLLGQRTGYPEGMLQPSAAKGHGVYVFVRTCMYGMALLTTCWMTLWQPVPCAGDRRPVKVLLGAVGILSLSGATAGLLGIGGALIFNPYLLQLGMDPRVTSCPFCLLH